MENRTLTTRLSRGLFSALAVALLAVPACTGPSGNGNGEGPHEFDIVEVYDPALDMWTTLDPEDGMPTPRSTQVAVELGGLIYVIGGSDWKVTGLPRYKVVEAFDPATSTWSNKASMLVNREAPAAVAFNGKIYVVGGASSSAVFHDTVEFYDPATDSWTMGGDTMSIERYGPSIALVSGKIYVFGGLTENGQDVNTCEVYDPATDMWATATSMPTARGQAYAGTIGDTVYVVGGFIDEDSVTGVNERFIAPGSWNSSPTNMPGARGEMDGGVFGGKYYLVGGLFQEGTSKLALSILQVFDPVANSWVTLAAMPTARSEPAAAFANGKLYVFGGYDAR